MSQAKGHRIETCVHCNLEYCRTCSDSCYPDDYCSGECEQKAMDEHDAEEAKEEPNEQHR